MGRKPPKKPLHPYVIPFCFGVLVGTCGTLSVFLFFFTEKTLPTDPHIAAPFLRPQEDSLSNIAGHTQVAPESFQTLAPRVAHVPEVSTRHPETAMVSSSAKVEVYFPPSKPIQQTQQHTAAPRVVAPRNRAPTQNEYKNLLSSSWRPRLVAPPQHNSGLSTVSVILVARNEHKFLKKTLDSILETSPGGYLPITGNAKQTGILREIILVDDASDPPMETALIMWPPRGLLRITRLEQNQGAMMARALGARKATSDILIFLDCHVKTTRDWLPPILRQINENYRRLVTPSIPALTEDWTIQEGTKTVGQVFDWSLSQMQSIDSPNDWVMVLASGLFAISRTWWFESGEYDLGMNAGGMEQLEQAMRIWLCGGEIVVDRSSVVAHYYRKEEQKPYQHPGGPLLADKVRAVEVWFDEYKQYFYKSHPEAESMRGGRGMDLSERNRLRQQLACRPFSEFVSNFRPYLLLFGLVADDRARQQQLAGPCRYTVYPGKYLGTVSSVSPDVYAHDFDFATYGRDQAEINAKNECDGFGAICSGITCGASSCSARRGTPFLKDSLENEVTHVKICCRHEHVNDVYLQRVAYVAPVMPPHEVKFKPDDLDLALNRCEQLTDLCVGVTCDEEFCTPREGSLGLQRSAVGEVTFIKVCK